MSIEGGIRTILVNNAAVKAIIVARVFPQWIPAGTILPAIVYQKIAGRKIRQLSGESGNAQPTYEIGCWAATYAAVHALSEAVKLALKDYHGTSDSTVFQWITVIGDGDAIEVSPDPETPRFGRRIDIECFVNE